VKVFEKQSANEENVMVCVLTRGDCFGDRAPRG